MLETAGMGRRRGPNRVPSEEDLAWVVVLTAEVRPRPLYYGRSLGVAAARLAPGTCFGTGANYTAALTVAYQEAIAFATGTRAESLKTWPAGVHRPPSPGTTAAAPEPPHEALDAPVTAPVIRAWRHREFSGGELYIPSPAEIAEACQEIQATWTAEQGVARAAGIRSSEEWYRQKRLRSVERLLTHDPTRGHGG